MIYQDLLKTLLYKHKNHTDKTIDNETYVFHHFPTYGDFGFKINYNYTGLMAQPSRTGKNKGKVVKSKQGLFDIFITSGTLLPSSMSHKDILNLAVNNTTKENCYKVWRGENPLSISDDEKEQASLTLIMLAFFEQELNWGNEIWQRYTYFSPKVTLPKRIRPRDMLMGYILQAYDLGVENVAYWQESRPTTTTFISPDRTNYGFEDYPQIYKKYFTDLLNDEDAEALMCKKNVKTIKDFVKDIEDNPYYK